MKNIFLSPHLDDVVFSVGGFLYQLSKQGQETHVWTIFAGQNPPQSKRTPIANEIIERWGYGEQTTKLRIKEDQNALLILQNSKQYYFDFLDAIYRKNDLGENIINDEPDFIKEFNSIEYQNIISELKSFFSSKFKNLDPSLLYIPIAMGNHPDHKVLRIAVDEIIDNHPQIQLIYFADFPYTIRVNNNGDEYAPINTKKFQVEIDENSQQKWIKAISAYHSQFPDYWQNKQELNAQLSILLNHQNKLNLWKRTD